MLAAKVKSPATAGIAQTKCKLKEMYIIQKLKTEDSLGMDLHSRLLGNNLYKSYSEITKISWGFAIILRGYYVQTACTKTVLIF
jgi:hypothetical protein